MDSKKKPSDADAKKQQDDKQKEQDKKSNPFDQKVKPAFDDLEDIGFDLDSDRPIEFNNKGGAKQHEQAKDIFGKDKKRPEENDNGLFADFGDDLDDDYEEDFEDD